MSRATMLGAGMAGYATRGSGSRSYCNGYMPQRIIRALFWTGLSVCKAKELESWNEYTYTKEFFSIAAPPAR